MPAGRARRRPTRRPRINHSVASTESPHLVLLKGRGIAPGGGNLRADCYRSASPILQKNDAPILWRSGRAHRGASSEIAPHREYQLASEAEVGHLTDSWPHLTTSFRQRRKCFEPKAIMPPRPPTFPPMPPFLRAAS